MNTDSVGRTGSDNGGRGDRKWEGVMFGEEVVFEGG